MEVHRVVGFLLFAVMAIQITTGFGYRFSKTKNWKLGFKNAHWFGALVLIILISIQAVTVWNFMK